MTAQFGDPRLPERFWNKVRPVESGCWEWVGSCQRTGYGQYWQDGKLTRAHRAAYAALAASIPDGLTIDHLCRNKGCVNPDHMEPVTAAENVRRATPHLPTMSGDYPCGHPRTNENTVTRKNKGRADTRVCRDCGRARSRANYAARKAVA